MANETIDTITAVDQGDGTALLTVAVTDPDMTTATITVTVGASNPATVDVTVLGDTPQVSSIPAATSITVVSAPPEGQGTGTYEFLLDYNPA